eukprot:CAMPEP_0172921588 /NCGR_PEP_ID=MMETSP1075-20121228/206224_1 /TAXON_ID=2916 /ORGANISM="Ceratium fusus, Strain PA161109" /LENGTH=68 /DNA_ID=CAMNT_0013781777 /DNA_START=72 /DNA_END=274 /DNA_ORIENTATION=-
MDDWLFEAEELRSSHASRRPCSVSKKDARWLLGASSCRKSSQESTWQIVDRASVKVMNGPHVDQRVIG